MARVLIIAQHEDGALNPATAKTLAGAKGLGIADIDIAVFAESGAGVAQQASRLVLRVLGSQFRSTVEKKSNFKLSPGPSKSENPPGSPKDSKM